MEISEIEQQILSFLDTCIGIGCCESFLLQREYLPSALNVLTNSPKTSYMTKRDILQLNFCESHEKNDKSALLQLWAVFETI